MPSGAQRLLFSVDIFCSSPLWALVPSPWKVIPRASPTILGAHRKRSHTRVIFSFSTLPKPSQGCPITFSMSMMNLHFRNPLQKNHPFFPESPGNSPLLPRPRLGNRFNFSLSCQLPQSLTTLKLGEDFNQSLEGAPWRGQKPEEWWYGDDYQRKWWFWMGINEV